MTDHSITATAAVMADASPAAPATTGSCSGPACQARAKAAAPAKAGAATARRPR